MIQVHYGVVQQDGGWRIIGPGLSIGPYKRRSSALRAAKRLADKSSGLPVQLHVQDETGELLPPVEIPS